MKSAITAIVSAFLICPTLASAAAEPFQLTLSAPIDRWDEAVPLGNGLLGGLLWGSGNEIRLSLDPGRPLGSPAAPGVLAAGFQLRQSR